MAEKEVARQADMGAHIRAGWTEAHQIWPNVKTYIDSKPAYLRWKTTPAALTLTNDGANHDLDLTANTSARAVAAVISAWQDAGGGEPRWFKLYLKPKGATDWAVKIGWEINDSGDATCWANFWGGQAIIGLDSGQELTYLLAAEGSITIQLVGYYDQEG
jgi:hypothetical protein